VSVDVLELRHNAWPLETLLAFVGPVSVVVSAALTFACPLRASFALALPIGLLAISATLLGRTIQAPGIAWIIVLAHAYTAFVGRTILALDNERVSRLHTRFVALLVATSAPAIVGWSLAGLGLSMRVSATFDCVFLAAFVARAIFAWKPRHHT
jgi:hypothetical protein